MAYRDPIGRGSERARTVYANTPTSIGVPVHRVSQGSGVMLMTDDELDAMSALGRQRGIEISLFVGPRAGWDTGAMAYTTAGKIVGPKARGTDQLVHAVEDVKRALEHGINSVLVTDEGLLLVLGKMKEAGELTPRISFSRDRSCSARPIPSRSGCCRISG